MNMTSEQKTTVYIIIPGEGYVPAGILKHFPMREHSTFRYGKKYLQRPNALPIDPVKLPLIDTAFGTPKGQKIFNVFRDAAPDRWGRLVLSIVTGIDLDDMTELDILTALSPKHRIGALAFGPDPFSGPQSTFSRYEENHLEKENDLKTIARYVRLVDQIDDDEIDNFRKTLSQEDLFNIFVPSLSPAGGARPKALVTYDGTDWIAKFRKRRDRWDEPVIEHACMTLARECGITVPETRIVQEENSNILLVKRFDKDDAGNLLHFASGFTIADFIEDESWGGYQDLAEAARRYGAVNTGEQIFRRMLFNICCANTDDHPRNHAFFIHREKIELTPAYDIVPCRFLFDSYDLALKVGKQGRLATFENAMSDIGPFGLNEEEALSILTEIKTIFSGWQEHFKKVGVNSKDIENLSLRFSHSNLG